IQLIGSGRNDGRLNYFNWHDTISRGEMIEHYFNVFLFTRLRFDACNPQRKCDPGQNDDRSNAYCEFELHTNLPWTVCIRFSVLSNTPCRRFVKPTRDSIAWQTVTGLRALYA